MNVTLWVFQVLLAVVLAATGAIKFTQPRLSLQGRMAWVVDVSDAQVKGIGGARGSASAYQPGRAWATSTPAS